MSGARQIWLVARREMRERIRSRAFRASLVVMILVVAGVIVVPSLLDSSGDTRGIGLSGSVPAGLANAIRDQATADRISVRVRNFDDPATGETAVRDGDVDVLVIGGQRLEWKRQTDDRLRAVVAGAIQLVAVRERAADAGISPDALAALAAPVSIADVELGSVAERSPDDETAALLMTVLLFVAITTYGNLVLTGVVEEKASRVVEVLLARIPAGNLLAGKVAGIGLLGLAQFGITALVALATLRIVDTVDIPAARGAVIAWAVVWFVLGYALYAMVYGALGSLASRTEDAQSVAGPVIVVLMAGYFASFAAVGRPDSGFAKAASLFPGTAPLAMPNRIAMGATAWWEPVIAVVITLATIAGLVHFGGRVYAGAILHSGPTLKLRDAWRGTTISASTPTPTDPDRPRRWPRRPAWPGSQRRR